ncbi:MAG: hypothetical protein COT85_05940 [Chlamydiae bacterium CG10_big_fil_rev_8_21_14_0_10_42_34]|nr:MAG: hypothetical protein COT85_05940 [Chlamydiae bacterium CG10_big_fil_rev_8_21_14_0_10_42_34]
MRLKSLVFGLIALSLIVSAFAETTKVTGANQYGEVTLDTLDGVGLIKLNATTVETINLTGSLITQDAQIGTLNVIGEANLKGTTIQNAGSVMGSLQATRSTFQNTLTILSQKALFTTSTLEAITVKRDSGYKGKQILELRHHTIINGPIHFESGKGEVIVHPTCQVLGEVTGGKVIKKH